MTDVKLLQGDLAEAWREGETDYASVAMRFSLVDKTLERGTNRWSPAASTRPRPPKCGPSRGRRGADWELSAIQQTADRPRYDIRKAPRLIPRRLFVCRTGCRFIQCSARHRTGIMTADRVSTDNDPAKNNMGGTMP